MRLLRLAIEKQRWDLAAHTIILATARILSDGDDRPNASKSKRTRLYAAPTSNNPKRREKDSPERSGWIKANTATASKSSHRILLSNQSTWKRDL